MKTTILGVVTIIAVGSTALANFLKTGNADLGALISGVTAGVGLIKAADAKKH